MTIDKTLNNALGDKKSYVTGADEVFIARLEVAAVTSAQQRALNDNNYSHQRIRCKNEYLIGIKYSGGNKIVDFALGLPFGRYGHILEC